MADWVTISSLATGAGTMVLALATFASVKTSNRSARVAERALLAQQRPVLATSRDEDPDEHIRFVDDYWVTVSGHGAAFQTDNDCVYMAMPLRNIGAGIAVIHGWVVRTGEPGGTVEAPPDLDRFRRQTRDLYVAAGDVGFWQGAVRDPDDPDRDALIAAAKAGDHLAIYLLYGDHEGGQRTIARFSMLPDDSGEGLTSLLSRYWNVDRDDPR